MIKLNVHEAKTHLSRYLDEVARGETIVLCKRNAPVAEIRAVPKTRRARRPIGLAKGSLKIPKKFFQPLPVSVIARFRGETP